MKVTFSFVCALVFAAWLAACQAIPASSNDAIHAPFTSVAGDALHGRTLVISREGAHCILCHSVPAAVNAPDVKFAGNIGPPLAGVGARLNPAQLRRRVADITVLNPEATMPAFHRVENLQRVAPEYRGKPVLSGQDMEDVIAYLASLR